MYDPTKPETSGIFKLIEKTWNTPYISVQKNIYQIYKKKFDFSEVDHTDGIGTKGYYYWKKKTYANAAIDALAMNLNDLLLVRATAYKLQNHLILPRDDKRVVDEIMKSLVKECLRRRIAIVGGETSIHNDLNSIDISITVTGFVKKIKKNKFQKGDVLVGISSSGLHSNGFTKVRELFGKTVRNEFLVPTRIYTDIVEEIYSQYDVHGMMHITGGAFSKLKPLLAGLEARITNTHKLKPQKIFFDLYKKGIVDREMYTTFNCGVGFIMSMSAKDAQEVITHYKDTDIIGKVGIGKGNVIIDSVFSNKSIKL